MKRPVRVGSMVVLLISLALATGASCPRPATQPARHRVSSVGPFVSQLSDARAQTRVRAVRGLGERRDSRAAGRIAQLLLRDPNAGVRQAAAWACGRFQLAMLVRPLKAALSDPAATVRLAAVRALGAHRSRAAAVVLVEVIASEESRLRRPALRTLARMPRKLLHGVRRAVHSLVKMVGSYDKDQAVLAQGILVAVGVKAVGPLLELMLPLLTDDSDGNREADLSCRSLACRTIVGMGGRAVPALLHWIGAEKMDLGEAARYSVHAQRVLKAKRMGIAAKVALRAVRAKARQRRR